MRWILPVGRAMALQNGQLGAMNQRTSILERERLRAEPVLELPAGRELADEAADA